MKDGIIKGDGTSRFMRSTLPATYEEFKALAEQGKVPMDVLFNETGWSQQPDFLNKKNLLTDATAALYGLQNTAVPDEVFGKIAASIGGKAGILEGSYVGNGAKSFSLNFAKRPRMLFIFNEARDGTFGAFSSRALGNDFSQWSQHSVVVMLQTSGICKINIDGGNPTIFSASGGTVSISSSTNAEFAFNKSGATYRYMAFV